MVFLCSLMKGFESSNSLWHLGSDCWKKIATSFYT